jgi:hypothetical protein
MGKPQAQNLSRIGEASRRPETKSSTRTASFRCKTSPADALAAAELSSKFAAANLLAYRFSNLPMETAVR